MSDASSLTRRGLLGGAAGLAGAMLGPDTAAAAPHLGEDGLYTQDWYVDSFLDLAEDLAAATAQGRHFALQWSQRGCIYCKTLHTGYFADPAIEGPIKAAFDIVHLDLFGAREVTAFDGTRLAEKALGQRERIRATPTFQFFALRDGTAREVARMPGLLPQAEFSAMFTYVAAGAYARESFDAWLARAGRKS
ncbi:thioredoxin fold domain-containing protein [Xanthobacter dioxanivorans]|uniref:Thioredoxin fold domain-containing protein n=1 Tax=Xanthobacter dioxanivorans TaxID=2528964 RepID=A0A974SK02_9HYPH|nr:thioredoxin family protein [Xanthobacter dioxanivorans]QRG06983.1 thioredoxin fold domain-containing protein [Xanthobacter dioxanivorans]